jgi:hypothetical protein
MLTDKYLKVLSTLSPRIMEQLRRGRTWRLRGSARQNLKIDQLQRAQVDETWIDGLLDGFEILKPSEEAWRHTILHPEVNVAHFRPTDFSPATPEEDEVEGSPLPICDEML